MPSPAANPFHLDPATQWLRRHGIQILTDDALTEPGAVSPERDIIWIRADLTHADYRTVLAQALMCCLFGAGVLPEMLAWRPPRHQQGNSNRRLIIIRDGSES